MRKQSFGVEIEGYGINKTEGARVLAELFGTRYAGGTIATDQQGREWTFKDDCSLKERKPLEFVTPPLAYEDLPLLRRVVEALKAAGMKADAQHQDGLHIHIGADGHTGQTLLNLANMMRSRERLIWAAIQGSEEREIWCQDTSDRELEYIREQVKDGIEAKKIRAWDRYYKLNLSALRKHGTVEFRLFELKGDLDADRIEAYINLALAMNASAKKAKTASPKKVETENPKFAMRTWLNRLGMIGPEFATTRRVLTESLSGNGAWASGTPHEVGYHRAGA